VRSDRLDVPIQAGIEATLTQGVTTRLHRTVWKNCRLVVTGIAGEFSTIPFQTKTSGFLKSQFFEATQVTLKGIKTIPSAEISATTPEGVGSLDIVYEVRTGADV
jgi:hypothetical protein